MSDTIEKNSTGPTTDGYPPDMDEFIQLITKLAEYMYDVPLDTSDFGGEPLTSEESVRLMQMLEDPRPSPIRDIHPDHQTVGEERKHEMYCMLKAHKDVAEGGGPTEEQIEASCLKFAPLFDKEWRELNE